MTFGKTFKLESYSQYLQADEKLFKISVLPTKEMISKVKRKPSKWEKIITNEATDKGLISKNIQTAPAAQFQKNK